VIAIQETDTGVSFAVRIQPRARRNAIVGELGDAVKIALTAPPVNGRANDACVEFLADLLSVPRSAVSIISGQKGRRKVILISGISAQTLRCKFQP
jgi:uncharacterized protein